MHSLRFQQAVDPRVPFRSLAKAIPERERRVLAHLKERTGLDVEALFDKGEAHFTAPSLPSKQFTVIFSQTPAYRPIPLFTRTRVDLRITIVDPDTSQQVTQSRFRVFRDGSFTGFEEEYFHLHRFARGNSLPKGTRSLAEALNGAPIHFLDVLPEQQRHGLGFYSLYLMFFLGRRIYEGRSFPRSPITPDSQPFYQKAFGPKGASFRTRMMHSLYHGREALPIITIKIAVEPALVHLTEKLEEKLAA